MNPHFQVITIICEHGEQLGERLPLLINRETAVPLFWPSLYSMDRSRHGVSMRRGESGFRRRKKSGNSASTLRRRLEAIMFLYTWSQLSGIDIEQRFRNGEWLSYDEILKLVAATEDRYDDYCDANLSKLRKAILPADPFERSAFSKASSSKTGQKIVDFERRKKRSGDNRKVSSAYQKVTLEYITDYLDWLSKYWLYELEGKRKYIQIAARLDKEREDMLNDLIGRIPEVSNIPSESRAEGLAPEDQDRLLQIVHHESAENPWQSNSRNPRVRRRRFFERIRNLLFVQLLFHLGVRRGELLNLELQDIDTDRKDEAMVFIRRSPDNPRDKRIREPNAKTNARLLPVNEPLADLIDYYRENVRPKIEGSGSNTFLFVSTLTGREMSDSTATQIFETIRKKHPELPESLMHPHILRHTWNENFWEFCQKHRDEYPPEIEILIRTRMMGHSSDETASRYYLWRSTKNATAAAARKMQDELMERIKIAPKLDAAALQQKMSSASMQIQDTIHSRVHAILGPTPIPRAGDEYNDIAF